MKALFDTSVLVAAFEVSHPRHGVCLPWLQRVQEKEIDGYLSTHTLAELYSVLTRLPVKPPISPVIAQRLINENLHLFEAISLTADDYQQAIACMVRLNLPGGGIFDALIAQAALKAEVDILLTLNPSHFTRLGQDLAQRVQVPS
ncbi:MAG: PIN domain-containing protein [Brasilonema angustatum HA4187-MV1]|jgi:predicted nucleic acid-binding protein|nr:PIN domain-containing protein [Brasilonema angustatum HA4187-MV1]